MNSLQFIREFENYPIFTVNDVSRIINSTNKYIRTYLSRLEKKGLINRIERGKYSLHTDPWVFTSHLIYPSYISMWSAFSFKGLTEQIIKEVMVITPVQKKDIVMDNYSISFTKSSFNFGYGKYKYREWEIFVADTEKSILDSILYNKVPIDEIIKVIENTSIDINKLISYIVKIGSSSLVKRTAFLLEQAGYDVEALNVFIDYNYVKLDISAPKTGKTNKKWRVIVNVN